MAFAEKMPCGGQGTANSIFNPCLASRHRAPAFAQAASFLASAYAGGKEGHVVGAEDRVFVGVAAEHDDLADLGLAALYGALDLVGLEQRSAGWTVILSLPPLALSTSAANWVDVLGVEIAAG
jgi:hypothetical protein